MKNTTSLYIILFLLFTISGNIANALDKNIFFEEVNASAFDSEDGCVPPSAPTNTTATANLTRCSGNTTTLSVTGSGTIRWYNASTGGSLLWTGSSYTTGVLTSNTTFYAEDSTCAVSTSRTAITVTVHALPNVTASSSSNVICLGKAATLAASNAASYVWNPGGLVGSFVSVMPTFPTAYTVTGTSLQGCTKTATLTIFVNQLPNVTSSASSPAVCAGGSATLTGFGTAFYNWLPGGQSGTSIVVTPTSTSTYTVIGVDLFTQCTNTSTQTITVNPAPSVGTTASVASICQGNNTTIIATGANTYTWMPGTLTGASVTVSPASTTTYTVTGTSTQGCTKTSTRTITVTPPCGSPLNVKLFIQGFYAGNSTMTPTLLNQGVAGATTSMTDSITIELRDATPPYPLAASVKTMLSSSGDASAIFNIAGPYYIAIKHRNGLTTWSANPITLSAVASYYDFSNAANKAYGNNMVNLASGVFGFYSGDLNVDENIDIADLGVLENAINNFSSGYDASDINGDGNVDIIDATNVENNVNGFIFTSKP